MKKSRYFLLIALLTASQAAAQTIPSTQNRPDSRVHLADPCVHLADPCTHLSDPRTHLSEPRTLDISDLFNDRFYLGGLDDKILSSTVHDGVLYVGGDFTWLDGITLLNRIAMWDGTTLQPVGDGFNGTVRYCDKRGNGKKAEPQQAVCATVDKRPSRKCRFSIAHCRCDDKNHALELP